MTEKATCPFCKVMLTRPDPDNLFCPGCRKWNPHERPPYTTGPPPKKEANERAR